MRGDYCVQSFRPDKSKLQVIDIKTDYLQVWEVDKNLLERGTREFFLVLCVFISMSGLQGYIHLSKLSDCLPAISERGRGRKGRTQRERI